MNLSIPVVIPAFNNPTYVQNMLRQLVRLKCRYIVIIDGGSTLPSMTELLDREKDAIVLIKRNDNPGPHFAFKNDHFYSQLPRLFCVTDPDLLFNPSLPGDFLEGLVELCQRERVGKAGFALDISDRRLMRDEEFLIGERRYKIWEWERQFWEHELSPLERSGDPVFKATVDTTFALYDKNHFDRENHMEAVRVAGRFTCKHLPWYTDTGMGNEEERFYRETQKYSYYLGDMQPSERQGPPVRPA